MHRVVKVVAAVAGVLLLPSFVFAQATIENTGWWLGPPSWTTS